MPRSHLLRAAAGLLFCLGASPARAHLVSTGMGAVYDGMAHFFLSPGDVLPVVALAILAGLQGPAAGRRTFLLLPATWLSGGVVGVLTGVRLDLGQWPAAAALLLLGGLAAIDRRLPTPWHTMLPLGSGAAFGFLDGAALREAGVAGGLLQLVGVSGMLFVLTPILAGAVVSARPAWLRIVVRVAGSWLAAIGLLLAGWTLRGT